MVRRHVILHIREGYSLDGILSGLYADGVELADARFIRADDYDTALDGVQIVPWTSIVWVQELSDVASAENA
jgi:hypothetical protein